MPRAQATVRPGAWRISRNPVWEIPDGVAEVRFEGQFLKPKGLVIDALGRVYGPRTLQSARQDGYCLFGRVSVSGRSVRAFTGSQMFEREDGSLVDVAVLRISAQPPFESALRLMEAAKCS